MSSEAVDAVREQLDALIQAQASRRIARDTQGTYRLSIQDEGDSRAIPRQVLCVLETPDASQCSSSGQAENEDLAHTETWLVPKSAKAALKAGRQTFSGPEDFEAHLAGALEQAAFMRLTSKLAARDRSSREMEEFLVSEGYDRSAARKAVERACRSGLIDDLRFSQAFVCSKRRAGWGSRRIERDLLTRGVCEADVQKAMGECADGPTELERALGVARKKRMPEKNPTEKLARFLAGRGFSGDIALRVAKQVIAESREQPDLRDSPSDMSE